MRRYWVAHGARVLVMIAVAIAVFSFGVMWLWNWLLPPLFGWHAVSLVQAAGMLLLCRILFGGFHGRGRHGMDSRWRQMSPEDHASFREEMRARWYGGRPAEAAPPQA